MEFPLKKKKNHYKIMMRIILTGTKKPQQKGSNNPDINSFVWRDFQALLSFCLFVWEIEETFYFSFFPSIDSRKKNNTSWGFQVGRQGAVSSISPLVNWIFLAKLQQAPGAIVILQRDIWYQEILPMEKGRANPSSESGNTELAVKGFQGDLLQGCFCH